MYSAPTIKISVTTPYFSPDLPEPSYFDVKVTSSGLYNPLFPAASFYDGWCLDKNANIGLNTTYTASIYSAYETSLLSAVPNLNVSGYANLDNVNWLLNFYTGSQTIGGHAISYGDVQGAIWRLMGYADPLYQPYAGPQDAVAIEQLYNLALSNDGYVPDVGGTIGVILDPIDASGNHKQPLMMETKAAKLGDYVWNDLDADGIQDGNESGIAGATVRLVRDLDGNGSIGAGEVLATTTTDGAGAYNFKGLTPGLSYQVQFTLPSGYDALSPRQADGSAGSGSNSDAYLSNVVVLAPGEYNRTIDGGFTNTPRWGTASGSTPTAMASKTRPTSAWRA